MNKTKKLYESLVTFVFFIYLAGVLSFGRAFLILHLKIGPIPIFITEFFLLFAIPMVVFKKKKIFELPNKFLIVLSIYFLMGVSYLSFGVLTGNLFSLRDIVLCGYVLFLPIAFIVFSKNDNVTNFLYIYIGCNIVCILAGRICIFNSNFFPFLNNYSANSRMFNFGLYYGIAASFFMCLLPIVKERVRKFFLSFILTINLYMIFLSGERAAWIGLIILTMFFLFRFGLNFFRLLGRLLPFFCIVFPLLWYFDFIAVSPTGHIKEVRAKVKNTNIIVQRILHIPQKESLILNQQVSLNFESSPIPLVNFPNKNQKTLSLKNMNDLRDRDQAAIDNIAWRLKLWQQSIKFGLPSLIFGRGFGIYPDYRVWHYEHQAESSARLIRGIGINSNIVPPHNHLVTIFYKMGLLGLSLFLFINIYVLLFAFFRLDPYPKNLMQSLLSGFLGAFIYWHVLAFFFNVIDSPSTNIFLWVIIGTIFAVILGEKTEKLPNAENG